MSSDCGLRGEQPATVDTLDKTYLSGMLTGTFLPHTARAMVTRGPLEDGALESLSHHQSDDRCAMQEQLRKALLKGHQE